MRKSRRYHRRNKKKFYVKAIKINNLYPAMICMIIILMIINIINGSSTNIMDFLLEKFVPSCSETEENYKSNTDKNLKENITSVVGINDVTFENEADKQIPQTDTKPNVVQTYDKSKFDDPEYLKNNFYIVDKRTQFVPEQFSAQEFLSKDLTIDTSGSEPKVLIFHTHSHEGFVDGNPNDLNDGIYGVGELLAKTLTEKYGIVTMHDTGKYDYVDGKVQILGAYERMEPAIEKVLKDNPSIEVVIDLHRDGVDDSVKLMKNINGKPTAQIMFFNGLCKYLENGKLVQGAKNPYLDDNLAFSFQMQLKSKELYPDFTRKIYLHAYRFSLHMKPRSLLIELGAQTNTVEEARNAVEPLAEILSEVLVKK